jgi:hypothetical protein
MVNYFSSGDKNMNQRIRRPLRLVTTILCLVAGALHAAPQASSEAVDRLYAVVAQELRGLRVTKEAEAAVRQAISAGLDPNRGVDEENLRKFGREMSRNSRFDENTGGRMVDTSSFEEAKKALCPLYPFC